MIVEVGALVDPVAARLGVRTLYRQFVQHGLQDLGHWQLVLVRVDIAPTRGTRLETPGLRVPGVVETDAAEVVVAGEVDGLVIGTVANEAHEVAVVVVDIIQQVHIGWDSGHTALATLRRW